MLAVWSECGTVLWRSGSQPMSFIGTSVRDNFASGAASKIVRDPRRVAAVRDIDLLRRPPSHNLDRLTRLAAELLEAPVALLTLVDIDRQFFLSSYGLGEPLRSARQTPLDYSICQLAVATGHPLVVPDTCREPRLAGNRAVVDLGVAAYAGIPLNTGDHLTLGALCVADFVRRDWTDDQLANLALLAGICLDEIHDPHPDFGSVRGT